MKSCCGVLGCMKAKAKAKADLPRCPTLKRFRRAYKVQGWVQNFASKDTHLKPETLNWACGWEAQREVREMDLIASQFAASAFADVLKTVKIFKPSV